MIKFFRQIRLRLLTQASSDAVRQRMIKENPSSAKASVDRRVSKYLLYALGEIILVVIGILLAVQINDWNENRKAYAEEVVILESLHENLMSAKTQSEKLISREQLSIKALIIVLNIDSIGPRTNMDSISDDIFKEALWNIQTALPVLNRYNDLKSANKLSLIRNQEIKEKFTLVELNLENVKELLKDRMNIQQIRLDEVAQNDINFLPILKSIVPQINLEDELKNDYREILMIQRIRNLLGMKLFLSQDVLNNRKSLGIEINELIVSIESELNERKE